MHTAICLLRKLREKYPQFTGITEHFLDWITECQLRKEQRNLQDAVAIQYAKMAMGETARGHFDTTRELATWEEFMQELKPKFMLHTAHGGALVGLRLSARTREKSFGHQKSGS